MSGGLVNRFLSSAITWEQAVAVVQAGTVDQLGRSEEQYHEYQTHMDEARPHFASTKDYIFHSKFLCPFLPDGSKQVVHPLALIEQQKAAGLPALELPRLLPNSFPYLFTSDVSQFVLWDVKPPASDDVLRQELAVQVSRLMGVDALLGVDYVYWVNPDALKSIPEVWHAHVLIHNLNLDVDGSSSSRFAS